MLGSSKWGLILGLVMPLAASAQSLIDPDGAVRRDFPRLQFGGAHLADPATQWAGDVAGRAALGGALALVGRVLSDVRRGVAQEKIAYRRMRQGR